MTYTQTRQAISKRLYGLLRPNGGYSNTACYIAGPMRGLPNAGFSTFDAARELLWESGWNPCSPADMDRELGIEPAAPGEEPLPLAWFMEHDLPAVCRSRAVFVLPGWDESEGALLEVTVALKLGIPVYSILSGREITQLPSERKTPCPDALLLEWEQDAGLDTVTAARYFKAGAEEGYALAADTKATNPKDVIAAGKLPLHLWPKTATILGALAFLDGMLKYGRSNWREAGVKASVYVDALERHVGAWFEGEDLDPDSDLPHLAHALACLGILVDAQAADKLVDDRQFNGGGFRALIDSMTPEVARLKEKHAHRSPKHWTIQEKV